MSFHPSIRIHANSIFFMLLFGASFALPQSVNAQCPPITVLTSCLGKNLGEFDATMTTQAYTMTNLIDLGDGKTVYTFEDDPDQSAKITITTGSDGLCSKVRLESKYIDCWAAFVETANADPATYELKLLADPEIERLGVYDISKTYRVSGSSRLKSDGRMEIGLMVTKL